MTLATVNRLADSVFRALDDRLHERSNTVWAGVNILSCIRHIVGPIAPDANNRYTPPRFIHHHHKPRSNYMTTPLAPPNSQSLASALGRDWVLRVRELGGSESDWLFVRGCSSLSPIFEGAEQDASDIDGEGYDSSVVTGPLVARRRWLQAQGRSNCRVR